MPNAETVSLFNYKLALQGSFSLATSSLGSGITNVAPEDELLCFQSGLAEVSHTGNRLENVAAALAANICLWL